MKHFPEMQETHDIGMVSIENIDYIQEVVAGCHSMLRADLGIQVASDGRVWVCLNGRALLRFKPAVKTELTPMKGTLSGRWCSNKANLVEIPRESGGE